MQVLVIGTKNQKEEFCGAQMPENTTWIENWTEEINSDFSAIIDLGFQPEPQRIGALKSSNAFILINSVPYTLSETDPAFIRFAGWNTFLKNKLIEAAATDNKKTKAEEILSLFGKEIRWVADLPGFISPRVVSMIINEAWAALQDSVSTKDEIDTAMKLGTNYPYGPFEWAEKIGVDNVKQLLERLSPQQKRYQPFIS